MNSFSVLSTSTMNQMSSYQYKERLPKSVVVIPIGALENHGPHLPLGVDSLIPQAIAKELSTRYEVLITPPINYGYRSQPKSGGGCHFVGTTCVSGKAFTSNLKDIIKELIKDGAHHILLMNGHLENKPFIIEAINLLEEKYNDHLPTKIIRSDYWDLSSKETLAEVFPPDFASFDTEHGGILETSLMLYLYPELTWMDQNQ